MRCFIQPSIRAIDWNEHQQISALSPGWRSSFLALLRSRSDGNAGLAPASAAHPAAPGFQPLKVTAIERESADVVSLTMQEPRWQAAAGAAAWPIRRPAPSTERRQRPLFRSYSLSGPVSTDRYRISVKVEPNGVAGAYLRDHVRAGDLLEVSSPRGSFVLRSGESPVVLISAGIGATPVLAMLYAMHSAGSRRRVLWLHAARDGRHFPFADEVRRLVSNLAGGRSFICFSRPEATDRPGNGF